MPDFSFVILRINLSQKKIQEEIIRPSWVHKFLGGRGLGAKILFDELAPRFKDKQGGYTRIVKTGRRVGDNADMAILEWSVQAADVEKEAKKKEPKKGAKKKEAKKESKKETKKEAPQED